MKIKYRKQKKEKSEKKKQTLKNGNTEEIYFTKNGFDETRKDHVDS